jgi:rhodanese-related sulfurtransferase
MEDVISPEGAGATSPAEAPEISRDEIVRRLHDPTLTLIDVLPLEAYAAEHIPGAISLPLAQLEERAPVMLSDRNADLVTYCAKFT